MNNDGVVTQLRKAFELIAKGLIKKQDALEANPKQYPYVPCLNHGINMFLNPLNSRPSLAYRKQWHTMYAIPRIVIENN